MKGILNYPRKMNQKIEEILIGIKHLLFNFLFFLQNEVNNRRVYWRGSWRRRGKMTMVEYISPEALSLSLSFYTRGKCTSRPLCASLHRGRPWLPWTDVRADGTRPRRISSSDQILQDSSKFFSSFAICFLKNYNRLLSLGSWGILKATYYLIHSKAALL